MSDTPITQRRPRTATPGAAAPAGSQPREPTTFASPSVVFTAPPSTVAAATQGPAGAPAAKFERVMEPTPPLPEVMAEPTIPPR